MTNPPEIAFGPVTETERIHQSLTTALGSIAANWPAMLPRTAPAQRSGSGGASARITADDHAQTGADIDPLTRVVSLRRFIMDVLNGWCRLVMEDRPVTNPKSLPIGTDVPGMCRFLETHAQWMSGHEAATDMLVEVDTLAAQITGIVAPRRREWINLGECPLPWVDEDGNQTVCGGTVRAWPRAEDRDGEVYARCRQCGEQAVVSWWESRMFDDPELKVWLTDADLVTFVHATYGKAVKEATIRQWVKRKVIEPSGQDEKGRRLFHREAVVWALDMHERRERVGT